MNPLLARPLRLEIFRFVIAGGINTLFTLALYWLLLTWFEYRLAYTVSFVVGIVSGFALNTYVVFRVSWSWMRLLAFPSVHAVNYVVGLAIVWLGVRVVGIDERIAPVVAAVVVIPLNFLMTRFVVKPSIRSEQAADR